MWGPDLPEAALRQHLQKLRKLANTFQNSAAQASPVADQHAGLITPTSSPKTPTKRPLLIEEAEVSRRRISKRHQTQNVKY